MTYEQIFIFTLLGGVFAMLVWGRIRYDLVALSALVIAVAGGVVPAEHAFSGFGHEAVVIIALVLVVSRAMVNAGAVEFIAQYVVNAQRSLPVHIGIMSVVGAALSAVINNVAALVILMTLDMETARKAARSVSLSLMPLSFATILGGMITLIGTPPNIVIAQYRRDAFGEPFAMFDFAPVGIVCAIAGIAFVATIGWRLLPKRLQASPQEAVESAVYVAEAGFPEDSEWVGKTPRDLAELADQHDVVILGLVRRGKRLAGFSFDETIMKSDRLMLEGDPKSIEAFSGKAKLEIAGTPAKDGLTSRSMTIVEAIVPAGARAEGRSADSMRLLGRRGVTLLGLSRQGARSRNRVRQTTIRAGDVLLLLGPDNRVADAIEWMGAMALADKSHTVIQRSKALTTIGIFAAAVAAAVAGLLPLTVALAAAVALYAFFNIVGPSEVYEAVEWPVIVLLGSLIPLGLALEETGGTALIADFIVQQTDALPVWGVLVLVMVVTMTLSDFLNNVATALIAAPVAVGVANSMGVNPDPFLMGVAVAASCAFLTPIGHKNNTIIMGLGGYRFGDYWRMGLPLEIIIILVSMPMILLVWPL